MSLSRNGGGQLLASRQASDPSSPENHPRRGQSRQLDWPARMGRAGLPGRLGRQHGNRFFSRTLVITGPQENGEQSEEFLISSCCFWVFSGRGFWKIIRAGLPHFFGLV